MGKYFCDDLRNFPAIALLRHCAERGAEVGPHQRASGHGLDISDIDPRPVQQLIDRFEKARKAIRIYHKAMFGDWFYSPASERRAIRAVLRLMPEVVPEGCHGYPELELERGRTQ